MKRIWKGFATSRGPFVYILCHRDGRRLYNAEL